MVAFASSKRRLWRVPEKYRRGKFCSLSCHGIGRQRLKRQLAKDAMSRRASSVSIFVDIAPGLKCLGKGVATSTAGHSNLSVFGSPRAWNNVTERLCNAGGVSNVLARVQWQIRVTASSCGDLLICYSRCTSHTPQSQPHCRVAYATSLFTCNQT